MATATILCEERHLRLKPNRNMTGTLEGCDIWYGTGTPDKLELSWEGPDGFQSVSVNLDREEAERIHKAIGKWLATGSAV